MPQKWEKDRVRSICEPSGRAQDDGSPHPVTLPGLEARSTLECMQRGADDEEDNSTPPSSPPSGAVQAAGVATRRGKFDDEESDSDVLDSWDAAEDSEVEREKAHVAAAKKAKADAAAAASKKSKAQRVAERIAAKKLLLEAGDSDVSSDEDEGISNNRRQKTAANAVVLDAQDPSTTIDLAKLPLFDPKTKLQFERMRETLVPLLTANVSKAHYVIFLQEFTKQIAKDLPSDQIKKVASGLTALSNEKMKEEKAAGRGRTKSKAAKNKVALTASRNVASTADVNAYDDDFGDDDFM
ncbi:hypothetical protein VE04_06056 [Pseudogymnoascus sp. 24MN13]|nr:hypothetical protein VE04_06056 [Pseudogymnoascus sp. 24MN13]